MAQIQINLKCSKEEMALFRKAITKLLKDTGVELTGAAMVRVLARRAALDILKH